MPVYLMFERFLPLFAFALINNEDLGNAEGFYISENMAGHLTKKFIRNGGLS